MKSLDEISDGKKGKIASLGGGGGFLSRITAMGFTPGTVVKVVRNGSRGPLIVELRDSEIAIGRGEASKILIREDLL